MGVSKNTIYALLGVLGLGFGAFLLWPVGHSETGNVQEEYVRADLKLIYSALEAYTGDNNSFPDSFAFISDIYRNDSRRVQRVLDGRYQLNPSLKGSTWRKIEPSDWLASASKSGQKILRSGEIVKQ